MSTRSQMRRAGFRYPDEDTYRGLVHEVSVLGGTAYGVCGKCRLTGAPGERFVFFESGMAHWCCAGEHVPGEVRRAWVPELILTLRTVSDDFTSLVGEYDPAPHALHALLRYLSPRPAARSALLSTARIDPRAGEWLLQETWPRTSATLCRASRR